MSNVPGPQCKVHLAGKELDDLVFYLYSSLDVYLGIITYDGKVSVGINLGEQLNVDPKELAKHWTEQFEVLKNDVNKYEGVIPKRKGDRKLTKPVSP